MPGLDPGIHVSKPRVYFTDWKGGALARQDGGCLLILRFMMRENADNAAIYGEERSFNSDDAGMRTAAPIVDAVSLQFGE